jgi:molybdopterin-guanine dinucleotide biosynthesis protein A
MRGAIIAGGPAARYDGRHKGLEVVGGERMLDRLVAAFVTALGEAPILVANAPEASSWRPELRVVPDRVPGAGATGGLYTAVLEAPAPVVCVAWDMPFVPAGLIAALAAGLAGHDACLPASDNRRGLEPMCAAYGPAAGPAMAAALADGDLRAIGFHDRISISILPLTRVRAFGDPGTLFLNVNTADDLAEANRRWRLASSR